MALSFWQNLRSISIEDDGYCCQHQATQVHPAQFFAGASYSVFLRALHV